MKKTVLLFFTFLITRFAFAQNNQSVLDYIQQYKNIAMEEMQRTGVPAAIILAQGINESQAGHSELAIETNNHFGIKCKAEWTGSVFYYDDDAKNECFRSYPCADDSYRDHSDFLAARPNYRFLFSLDPLNYKAWCYGLKRAGYATSNSYSTRLIKTIEDYNLEQYSELALNKTNTGENDIAGNNDILKDDISEGNNQTQALSLSNEIIKEEDASAKEENVSVQAIIPQNNYPAGIFTINNTKVMYANTGSSLFAIAANNNIVYKKLLEFNELGNEDILSAGMLIYLDRKPRNGSKLYHVAVQYETLKNISQTEGVQLQSILAYNNVSPNLIPSAGQKIYLQEQTAKTK